MIKRISYVKKFTAIVLSLVFIITLISINSAPAFASNITFSHVLTLGSTGNDVKILQKLLNTVSQTTVSLSGPGSKGNETTYFGAKTRAAVMRYQEMNNLVVNGIVDTATGDSINLKLQVDKATGIIGACDRTFNNDTLTNAYKYEFQKNLPVEGKQQAENDILKFNPLKPLTDPYIQIIAGPNPPPGAGPGSTVASSSFTLSSSSFSTINLGGFVRIIGCNFATTSNNVIHFSYKDQNIMALNSNALEFTLDSNALKLFPVGTEASSTFLYPITASGLVTLPPSANGGTPTTPTQTGPIPVINPFSGGSAIENTALTMSPATIGKLTVITGTGFTSDSYIIVDGRVAAHASSLDGKTLIFTLGNTTLPECTIFPALTPTCIQTTQPLLTGQHTISVATQAGISQPLPFTLIASGNVIIPPNIQVVPTLLSAVPGGVPLGGQTVLLGTGFNPLTNILIDGKVTQTGSSVDSNSMLFNVPTNPTCTTGAACLVNISVGAHQLQVSTQYGTSTAITFYVTAPIPTPPVAAGSATQALISYIQKQNLPIATADNPQKLLGLPVMIVVQNQFGTSNPYQMFVGIQK